jgi:hypothetical protein
MEKTKVKVMNTNIGKYDVDSITVELNGVKTEICFDKKDEVIKYNGKEIYLSNDKGMYNIAPVEIGKK